MCTGGEDAPSPPTHVGRRRVFASGHYKTQGATGILSNQHDSTRQPCLKIYLMH
jgi:hypothetical protein